MRGRLLALLAAVTLMGTAPALAQTTTGDVSGRVADSSGAVLPGVAVTLSGTGLLQPLTTVTGDSGSYVFQLVPIGTYSVRFELTGFRILVNEGVPVTLGTNTTINASLDVSTLEETITVTSEAPIVDTKKVGTKTTFTNEQLQNIPSARDPWVILERTPGIAMDRVNVGGSQSGQQSGYISRGATSTNNKWLVDGVDITDQAATGASPVYFDFDTFEQMMISTGGADVTQQTGGVGINIVTKSGTDQFKGSGRAYVTDQEFGSTNLTDELREQGARTGAPIQNIKDLGFEVGGPVLRGRVWFWGAYGKQDIKVGVVNFFLKQSGCPVNSADPLARQLSVADLNSCLNTDLTTLDNYNIKGTGQPFRNNTMSWHSFYADKIRNARDGSDLRPIETTFRQTGPVWTHKFSDRHVFSDRWLGEVQLAHVGGGFALGFNQDSLYDVQPLHDISTGRWARSFSGSFFDRPAKSVDLTSTYFLPAAFGADHSFKVGFRWRDTPSSTLSHRGGNTIAQTRNASPSQATLYRDAATEYGLSTLAFYGQDTLTVNKWTFNLGFRVDSQKDETLSSSVGAHPFLADYLPALAFSGADSGVRWTNFSPRLGATYDLFGNGQTVFNSSFATYYGQMGPGTLAGILNPVTEANIVFPWADTNGDLLVTRNELDTRNSAIISFGGNYNPDNPAFAGTENTVDPDIKNDRTREFIVGLDHQIGSTFAVGGSYIWRKYDNFLWDRRLGISSGDWSPVTYTPTCAAGTSCGQLTYLQPNFALPGIFRRENQDGFHRSFNGIELVVRKRLSNRWAADASYALNNAVNHYTPDGFSTSGDLSNFAQLSGHQYAQEAGGSGIDNVFVNSKHIFKLSGNYSLPWDIHAGATYGASQGYLFPQRVLSPTRINRAGQVNLILQPYGESRYPPLQKVDVRVAKRFRMFGRTNIEGSMDVFNLTNSNKVLTRFLNQAANNANNVTGIIAPRVLRFGVRMTF